MSCIVPIMELVSSSWDTKRQPMNMSSVISKRWLVSRGKGRPELYWPHLTLCEIYGDEDLPNIRNLSVEQNSQANELLFRLFDEFFELRSASLCRTARGQCNEC